MIAWMLLLASPADAGELREPLLELLSAYEHGASAEDLAKLGDGVGAELMEIAADTTVPHSRRGRAVTALGHVPAPEVRTFLEARLGDTDTYIQRKAVGALARGYGAAAVPRIEPLLADDDAQVRTAVVRALATIEAPSARAALEKHLPAEKDDTVRTALEQALGGTK